MQRWCLALAMGQLTLLSCHIPHNRVNRIILQLVKDTIRANKHVVKRVYSLLLVSDLWITRYNSLHSPKMAHLGLTITESTTYGESTREYSIWSHKRVFLIVAVLWLRARILPNLLRLSRRQAILHNSLSLINVPSSLTDSLELVGTRRLVIVRELPHMRCRLHLHLRCALNPQRLGTADSLHGFLLYKGV